MSLSLSSSKFPVRRAFPVLALGLVLLGLMPAGPARAQAPAAPAASAASAPSPTAEAASASAALQPAAIYQARCASCHGAQRTGGMGPALLPESLERLRPAELLSVITRGRQATQMAGFGTVAGGSLQPAEIAALAAWVRSPVVPAPQWTDADVRASRVDGPPAPPDEPARPVWQADPMNLFIVVEGGDHHVSLVDGDRLAVIHRFASRFALHGGPKFSPDGRYVYFGSRDGWITKYDLWRLRVVAEVRAGLNMRNVAVSGDGHWVMAANYLPHTVMLFDEQLNLVRSYPATALDGQGGSSRISAVYDAEPRKSFVVALKDLPELWEISYDPKAEPIYDGYVHDDKMGEGIAKPGYLNIRRTRLDEPLDDFFFDPSYRDVIGATRPQPAAAGTTAPAATAQVVNLDVRRKIADLPLAGMPHLGSGITFEHQGRRVLASPNLQGGPDGTGRIDVIDLTTWKPVAQISVPGPGFFLRSHEKTPYAWTDSMMSPTARDTLTILDKRTLKVVGQVREPGKTLAHIEFTRDGRYALASLWEMDGAVIVYDAATFQEVKRLPMSKPVGKYNLYNKLTRSEGTSH